MDDAILTLFIIVFLVGIYIGCRICSGNEKNSRAEDPSDKAPPALLSENARLTQSLQYRCSENQRLEQENEQLRLRIKQYNEETDKTVSLQNLIEATQQAQHCLEEKQLCFERVVEEHKQNYPWFSGLISDIEYAYDEKTVKFLREKKRPALRAADSVQKIATEKRELLAQNKMLQYQLNYYEAVFPWLEEFKEIDPKEAYELVQVSEVAEENSEYDRLRNWLSPEEYSSLSTAEKLQLALDRYNRREKTNWQIGIEYERFVGYEYEQRGFRVSYIGALNGVEDMGRDLIARSPTEVLIIQCKRWAQEKTIHEKHIFQLYGTVVLYQLQSKVPVRGVFVTTTKLSSVASDCADYLKIEVIENHSLSSYPQIKCNVSTATGEKIYHLPFDLQYDRTMLNPEDGDFYVATVKEAEEAGFRHAYRWHSE